MHSAPLQNIYVPVFATAILFSSCTSYKTDPYPPFLNVKDEIRDRSGEHIQWNKHAEDLAYKDTFIEEALSQDLSINDVIQITLLNNRRLQALYENLGIAQAELVQAALLKNPILDYQLRYDKGFGSDKVIEAGLIQNVLDLLLKPLKKKIAQTQLEITKKQIAGDVLEIIADAKIAFYTMQAAEQTLVLKKLLLDAAESAYDMAKRLHKAGNINQLKLTQNRSSYEQSTIAVLHSEMEVVDAREQLNLLMGLWGPQLSWKLSDRREAIPKEVPDFKEIELAMLKTNLDLDIARKNIYLTAKKVGIDTAEIIFPELGIGIDTERETSGNWFLGPQISIGVPIFDFGQATKAAGRSQLNKLCHEYHALAIRLRSQARLAAFRLLNAHQQCLYYEQGLIPTSEELVSETLLQLNAMQLSVFDLLLAKQQELKTREKETLSYKNYWIANTEFELLRRGRIRQPLVMEK